MNEIRQKLETVFRGIEKDRMQDMPMCNPALQVKAIGFDEWGEFYLGVMLTPWFMNLMLLPRNSIPENTFIPGAKQTHVFPSGRYEFVHAEEAALGVYQVCSLFSPVFEFQDQQTAVETGRTILTEVMDDDNQDTILTHEKTIAAFWNKEEENEKATSNAVEVVPVSSPILEQGIETPMSRRQLLRGFLPRGEE